MERFRIDNTEGYSAAELSELNAAWGKITSHGASSIDDYDTAAQSMLDHWENSLLREFDHGARGDALTAWFYTP